MSKEIRTCSVCGKTSDETEVYNREKFGKTLCRRHYKQMNYQGEIHERSRNDPNEIILHENHAEIVIYDRKQNEKARVKIDLEDIGKVSVFKWHMSARGYIQTNSQNKLKLHRLINSTPEGLFTDHINGDKLDNRKCNLRTATRSQNGMNRCLHSNNTSGVTGVYLEKNTGLWRVSIKVNSELIIIGRFSVKADAIKARRAAEMEYFGEFRRV